MKKYFYLSVVSLLIFTCSSPSMHNDAQIRITETTHDFGAVPYKKATGCRFEFSNPGNTVLLISDVRTSCGCTVAEWTKTPVKPGKSGTINVEYDAAFPGVFHKEITVYYNGPGSPAVLKIQGTVAYPDDQEKENP